MSQNNARPMLYVGPQDEKKLVAMVNAWMCDSVFDSGIFLPLVCMHREPAADLIVVIVWL